MNVQIKGTRADTVAVMFLCELHYGDGRGPMELELTARKEFTCLGEAHDCYANTPNPASQLVYATGDATIDESLAQFEQDILEPAWLAELANSI